jgi:photosystem II stability/assembly factor-like uncharacterized protein
MRLAVPFLVLTLLVMVRPARAADLRNFEDAALHAVQFVDDQEGWAVGDDGVVWHTIDAGKHWERQPSGVRASLRSVCFLNPFVGWVVGREELPGGGSAGVVLYTADGGVKWRRLLAGALPGLHVVRFVDSKNGYVAGEGADTYPSGVFGTTDGGRTWQPIVGPRVTAWQAAEFGPAGGALAGTWNSLATLRKERINLAEKDVLGGRTLRGLYLDGQRSVAVGQGGLVLTSEKAGVIWDLADLKLPAGVTSAADFHAVHGSGRKVWVAGRPGSFVLHSPDAGATWQVQKTGQPLPLNGLFFRDDKHGWAVGEFGTILGTSDGGRTWTVQQHGGQRAAVLFVHARAGGTPMDAIAWLGARDGYLTASLRVTSADPTAAAPARAGDPARYAAAVRQAGGAAGEAQWQFPLPAHVASGTSEELVKAWDAMHDDHAAEQMLRQLVLALRTWRPDVVITDDGDNPSQPADRLVAEAIHEAFRKAGDASAFPEQLGTLALEAWKPTKLYGLAARGGSTCVSLDLTALCPLFETTVAEFAAGPAGLLAETAVTVPAQRHFHLVESTLADAATHNDLMQGISLAPGGLARRPLVPSEAVAPEIVKAVERRANLRAMTEMPANKLVDPNRLLGEIGPLLANMPDDHAARAMLGAASQFARSGQWGLAREAYSLLVDRYPTQPVSLEAFRWLVRHTSSSEARRRHELGQFLVIEQLEFGRPLPRKEDDTPTAPRQPKSKREPGPAAKGKTAKKPGVAQADFRPEVTETENRRTQATMVLAGSTETRKWYQDALDIEPRLAAFGPLVANDPSMQFCLAAARRNLGEFDTARAWYQDFASRQPDGPWRAAAQAELWLTNRVGPPPKPLAVARKAPERPYLDGKLDDACWQHAPVLKLRAVGSDALTEFPAEVKLAYDQQFIYLAVRCSHPADRQVPLVKNRQRDADLSRHDRVSLSFDLDRDYSTSFNFHVDQRGCLREDCWGDTSWDPRWFVAMQSGPTGWTAEAAIPLLALTGDKVTTGRTWAFNAVRVIPGRGVQAWSLPADGDTPRPEGMGLLTFVQDGPETAPAR